MKTRILLPGLAACLVATSGPAAETTPSEPVGTVFFSSVGPRGWDLYRVNREHHGDQRLTDHPALDYNAAFPPSGKAIAFVSERDGNPELYSVQSDGTGLRRLTTDRALDDHPTWSPDGAQLAFVSTRRQNETPGRAWTSIFRMNADGSNLRCLSPVGASDYSPAWSPSGDEIAFASGSGKAGETDLYLMKPDGSHRRLVVTNGGWPSFSADSRTLYYHGQRQGKWGVWRVSISGGQPERLSPADADAFTPHASLDGRWLAAAVRRESHRQIEVLNLATREWSALTTNATDHWNPSFSPDGQHVVYHQSAPDHLVPHVERWGAERDPLQLIRVAGSFPALSPDRQRVAMVANNFTRLDVMNLDGSGRKTLYTGRHRGVFSVAWAQQPELIVFGVGASFQGPKGEVDLMGVEPDGTGLQPLTREKGNDAFPAFAPNGRQLVFRSGRDGNKNLYVMDRDGVGIRQLTQGKWTDTMPHWSPTGEWIAFSSDRDGNFEIWLTRPDGTGLHKLVGGGGRNTHPYFSPDGQWIVFTSQRAGYSAEEISLPPQPQPYGDLFAVRTDGSGLVRLFHNAFEEGTPAWGPALALRPSSAGRPLGGVDY